ncbi:MAG: delta-60 repeat domain-containing protein, partial [Verrucomicrobiota bacterium]|nr:delta-60 repeat domain-containing protein [Verrucomicrobiota bacterium]
LSDFDTGNGPNNTVFTAELTQSGSVYLGGLFNEFDGYSRKHIVRLKPDGSVDEGFNPGSRVKGTVFDIDIHGEHILVAGESGAVVLTLDGSKWDGFVPPIVDGEIYAVAYQSDCRILIGGSFENVNGEYVPNVARLNADGTLDKSFNTGAGPNGSVHAITIDDNGILIGGIFVTYDGISSRRIARLGSDGKLDGDFDIGLGFDGPVQAIHRRLDGRYLVGGSFGYFNGVIQNNTSLVNANGSVVENDLLMLQLNGAVYAISEMAGGSSIFGGSFTKDNKDRGYNSFALLHQISSIKPPRLGIVIDSATYQLSISGAPGEVYHVEFSSNLAEWLGLTKVVIPESGSTNIELGSSIDNRYFRAVYRE